MYAGKVVRKGTKPGRFGGEVNTVAIGDVRDGETGEWLADHIWVEERTLGNANLGIGDDVLFGGTLYEYNKFRNGKRFVIDVDVGIRGTGQTEITSKAAVKVVRNRFNVLQGNIPAAGIFERFGNRLIDDRWCQKTVKVCSLFHEELFISSYQWFDFDANWYGLHLRPGDVVTFNADVDRFFHKEKSMMIYKLLNPSDHAKVKDAPAPAPVAAPERVLVPA